MEPGWRELLDDAVQRRELDTVADSADQGSDGCDGEGWRNSEANVGESGGERAGAQHRAQRPTEQARKEEASDYRTSSPGCHEQAKASVARVEGGLRVADLDRPGGLEEHDRDRLNQKEHA